MNRRKMIIQGAGAIIGGLMATPYVVRAAESRWTSAISVGDYAPPGKDSSDEALQSALDASFEAGQPLLFPAGDWFLDRTLSINHFDRRRRSFPQILGAGVGTSRLIARGFEGPILSVHGGPLDPPAGTYFLYGGGVEGIEFVGAHGQTGQNGLEVLGWWNGSVRNCLFRNLGGHGIRVVGSNLDPNPDWTSSSLRVETCNFERLGGWGYIDDNPIGAPTWVFDRCMFIFCGEGGAFVRSSGTRFLSCSFALAGFLSENRPSTATTAVGLRIGDTARTTVNRTHLTIAEFDSNRDAHILIERSTSCVIEDARFIHNDRNMVGHITPPVAVLLGSEQPRSVLKNIRIIRPLVRIDHEAPVIGYRLINPESASDIKIDEESLSGHTANFTRTVGFPKEQTGKSSGIEIGRQVAE